MDILQVAIWYIVILEQLQYNDADTVSYANPEVQELARLLALGQRPLLDMVQLI